MRKLSIILVLALVGICLSTNTENNSQTVDDKRIEELLQTSTGKYALALAELNNLSGGPYDTLIEGIQYIVDDLESQRGSQVEAFGERIKDHASETVFLNDLISSANIDISQSTSLLSNALYPQKAQNQHIIDSDNRSIDETRAYMEKITSERESQNAAYQERVTEQNGALSAVDEAIDIMDKIIRGDVSFAEHANVIHSALKVASEKTQTLDPIDSEFIKTLLNMDSQKFTNMDGATRVRDLLKTVKESIISNLNQEHTDEKKNKDTYDEDYQTRRNEVRRLQRELLVVGAQLKVTIEWIEAKEEFLEIRKKDLKTNQDDLDAENTSYDAFVQWNDQLMRQYDAELSVAVDVLQLIQNAAFEHYLSRRNN